LRVKVSSNNDVLSRRDIYDISTSRGACRVAESRNLQSSKPMRYGPSLSNAYTQHTVL